jgi:hypothetical protein
MKINFETSPVLSLLKSLFSDTNKARVSNITDEIRRLFLYQLSHWYVLLSLILMSMPLIIMSAGKDIAYGLFDNQENQFWSSYVFILQFCWVLLLFALICWRLPLHYVADKYVSDVSETDKSPNLADFNFRDPMRQKAYRFNGFLVFALMIGWILSFAKVKLSIWDMLGIGAYLISLWKISQFFANHLNKQRLKWQSITLTNNTSFFKRLRYEKPLLAAFVPCIAAGLAMLGIAVFLTYKNTENLGRYFILAGSLGFMTVIFYVLADYVDRLAFEKREVSHLGDSLKNDGNFLEKTLKILLNWLKKPFTWFVYLFVTHDTKVALNQTESWKKPFLYIHVFCFVQVFLATIFFYLVPNMEAVHPVFCILYGVSLVVFVLDWLNYVFYRKYYIFVRWTLICFALLFAAMVVLAIIAKFKGEYINYISTGVNLMLLFLSIKWLRYPNIQQYAILGSGDFVDKTMLDPTEIADIETSSPHFLSRPNMAAAQLLSDAAAQPKSSWLSTPIRILGTRELPVFGILVVALFVIHLLIPNAATHDMALLNSKNEKPQMPVLMSPKAYITGWLDTRQKELGKDSFDVYIVAGQGGGSRGAYWFSKIMTEMDALTEGSFRQQCLAMSTVSGSSVGGQGIVSLWHSVPYSRQNNDSILSHFSHNAFQHNFLSGNLADLFFKDNIAAMWPTTGDFNPLTLGRGDRNHRLQHEEAVRIEGALQGGIQNVDGFSYLSLFKAFKLKSLKECTTNASFWSFYYDNNNRPLYKTPMLFANTCQVQGGKRSFVSPVLSDAKVFINSFNLTKHLINNRKLISLTSAANLSELFPYLSMASRLAVKDSLDINFVDGGYYENYGLTTAYELVRFCADSLKIMPKYAGIRLHLIAIVNSQDAISDNTIQGINQITAPVQAIMGATFGGHADHKLLEMRAKSGRDGFNFYELQLPYKDSQLNLVPLSRLLSKKSMDFMNRMAVDSMRLKSPLREMAIRKN